MFTLVVPLLIAAIFSLLKREMPNFIVQNVTSTTVCVANVIGMTRSLVRSIKNGPKRMARQMTCLNSSFRDRNSSGALAVIPGLRKPVAVLT